MVDYANGAEKLGALTFRRMDAPSAREIANWRYAPPYDIYNCAPGKVEEAVEGLLNPEYRYFSVWDDAGGLVGFMGFGDDARVPGGDYSADALDLGGGLRPDRTGQGLGASFIEAALAFGRRHYAPVAFRVTVAAFNRRALQVWERAGFCQVGGFAHADSREPFVVLLRDAERRRPF